MKLERRVALPRPRDAGLVLTPEFIALKREVLDAIEDGKPEELRGRHAGPVA